MSNTSMNTEYGFHRKTDGELQNLREFLNDTPGIGNDLSNGRVTSTGSTTTRTLADRFADIHNVRDFGAIGDGVSDDSDAIELALSSNSAVTGVSGDTYRITRTLSIPQNCHLSMSNSSILADLTGNLFEVTGDNVSLQDCIFDGQSNQVTFISSTDRNYIRLENIVFQNTTDVCSFFTVSDEMGANRLEGISARNIKAENIGNTTTGYGAIRINNANSPLVENVHITELFAKGVSFSRCTGGYVNNLYVNGGSSAQLHPLSQGLYFARGEGNVGNNIFIENLYSPVKYSRGERGSSLSNFVIDTTGYTAGGFSKGVYFQGTQECTARYGVIRTGTSEGIQIENHPGDIDPEEPSINNLVFKVEIEAIDPNSGTLIWLAQRADSMATITATNTVKDCTLRCNYNADIGVFQQRSDNFVLENIQVYNPSVDGINVSDCGGVVKDVYMFLGSSTTGRAINMPTGAGHNIFIKGAEIIYNGSSTDIINISPQEATLNDIKIVSSTSNGISVSDANSVILTNCDLDISNTGSNTYGILLVNVADATCSSLDITTTSNNAILANNVTNLYLDHTKIDITSGLYGVRVTSSTGLTKLDDVSVRSSSPAGAIFSDAPGVVMLSNCYVDGSHSGSDSVLITGASRLALLSNYFNDSDDLRITIGADVTDGAIIGNITSAAINNQSTVAEASNVVIAS